MNTELTSFDIMEIVENCSLQDVRDLGLTAKELLASGLFVTRAGVEEKLEEMGLSIDEIDIASLTNNTIYISNHARVFELIFKPFLYEWLNMREFVDSLEITDSRGLH